jgi:hypothetical protein
VKKTRTAPVFLNATEFSNEIKSSFAKQPLSLGQKLQVKFEGVVYFCTVQSLANLNVLIEEYGILSSASMIELSSKSSDLDFVGKELGGANSKVFIESILSCFISSHFEFLLFFFFFLPIFYSLFFLFYFRSVCCAHL